MSFDTAEWQMMVSQHSEWISFAQDNVGSADLKTILPQESAKQLENLVIAGDKEAMRKKLEQIREDYFVKRRLHGFQRQYLYCRLVSQLAAFNIEASDRKRIPDKLLDMGDEAFFEWLTKQFMECCDIVSRQNEKRTEKLIRSILDTIGENYGDYDLSLNSLAIQFGITTSYLSGLFKKETGMNFSAYLEQFRIEKSESLMQQSDRTIDEISQMVGYGNSDSFRRAYRRIRGISPSQYRTSAKQALS